jgi:serine/threonine protein kinase
MHRDLKPSNLLLDDQGHQIKLADFGLARSFGLPLKTYTHEVVTLWYRAPEILLGQSVYSPAVDLWSVGCIFYEMAHGKPLFYGDSEISQLFKIFQVLGTPTDAIWQGSEELPFMKSSFPKWSVDSLEKLSEKCFNFNQDLQAVDLLSKLVQLEPSKRLTVKQALNHPFFKSEEKLEWTPDN